MSATSQLVCLVVTKRMLVKLGKIFFIYFQNLFLFLRKLNFRFLDVHILWCHQMPKHKTIKRMFLNNLRSKHSLYMKFGQFMLFYKRKKLCKNCNLTTSSTPLCVCKELKLVSAIFIKFVFFHQMIALQKLGKMLFISSKKLFSFLRYSNFCIFDLPFFSTCRPLL